MASVLLSLKKGMTDLRPDTMDSMDLGAHYIRECGWRNAEKVE